MVRAVPAGGVLLFTVWVIRTRSRLHHHTGVPSQEHRLPVRHLPRDTDACARLACSENGRHSNAMSGPASQTSDATASARTAATPARPRRGPARWQTGSRRAPAGTAATCSGRPGGRPSARRSAPHPSAPRLERVSAARLNAARPTGMSGLVVSFLPRISVKCSSGSSGNAACRVSIGAGGAIRRAVSNAARISSCNIIARRRCRQWPGQDALAVELRVGHLRCTALRPAGPPCSVSAAPFGCVLQD